MQRLLHSVWKSLKKSYLQQYSDENQVRGLYYGEPSAIWAELRHFEWFSNTVDLDEVKSETFNEYLMTLMTHFLLQGK